MKKILTIILLSFQAIVLIAQIPSADFEFPPEVCLDENVLLSNNSLGAENYEWNFCPPILSNTFDGVVQSVFTNTSLRFSYAFSTVQKDLEIDAIGIRNNGVAYYYNFNSDFSSLLATSAYPDLATSEFSLPRDVKVDLINNDYIAFVSNAGNSEITKLNFQQDLSTSPITSKVNLTEPLINTHGLDLIKAEDKIVLFAGKENSNRIYRLSYDTLDIDNPSSNYFEVAAVSQISGISIIKKGNDWVGLVSSFQSNKLFLLNFGSNLINGTPTINELLIPDLLNPTRVKLVLEQNQGIAFVQSDSGDIFQLLFNENFESPEVRRINYSGSSVYSIGIVNLNNSKVLYNVDIPVATQKLNRFEFNDNCDLEVKESVDFQPTISYSAPGTYPITLTAFDEDGNSSSITKEITVTNNTAPEIDFETGTNLCITDPISFTGLSNETISNWSWDFGDGATATGPNPDHSFSSAGTYEVNLIVEGANGCNNRIQKMVTVYEPQPVTFTSSAQGAICSQKPILFENTTDLPEIATYQWSFGDGNSSTLENAEHVYQAAGDYTVRLDVNFAGCESFTEQTITVNPGPAVSFTTIDNCLGQTVNFQNTSAGEFITSYLWDFGDGTTSTQENPQYSFEEAGTQVIELTAFTSNGCDFTIQQEIEVFPVAVVDFSTDIACATQPVQFNEEVFLELSNVTDYLWDFGIAGSTTDISTEADPQFAFPAPGTYQVSLQVTTADGCVSQVQKAVRVEAIPATSFSYEPQCVGNAINFIGNATGNISANFWELSNTLGEVLAVGSQANFDYNFTTAGTYRLRYRQQNAQLCSNEYEEMIQILASPLPNFTFSQSCAGLPIIFQNTSELFGNTIASYSWEMGGLATLSNENPEFVFEEPGTYEVSLAINTLTGCTETITQTVEVKPLPDVAFVLEQTVGAFPFKVNATVQEQPDFDYQWTINGMIVSEASSLSETLEEAGNYLITLNATNSEGCTNTASQEVRVRVPEMDIALENLRVVSQGDLTGFVITISNYGSLIPDFIDLDVDLGQFTITERVDRVISPESTVNYVMRLNLTENQLRGLSKICLNAKVVSTGLLEQQVSDNRICTNLEDAFTVMDIYPNPARNSLTVPIIIPNNGDVMVVIEQTDAKQTSNLRFELEAGYNEVKIERGTLKSGIYFIRFRYEGIEKIKKVVFQ